MLDGMLGALEYLLYGVICQRVQPQFLDLLELLCVGEGSVVLVVVVQPEQGENLVDRLYPGFGGGPAPGASLPRRCR